MGDNSYGYRPEGLVKNFNRRPEKFANGTVPLAMGKETAISGDLSRIVQHEGWNQSAGFRENLAYTGAELKKLNRGQGQDALSSAWEGDRRDGHRRNSSNPLDMTLSRAQHHSSHAESSSSIQGTVISRNQPNAGSNSSTSYNPRSSYYSRPNTFRPNRSADHLLETSNRNPAEIARHLREREDVNGLPVTGDWSFRPNDVAIGHLPTYSDSQPPQRPLPKSRYPQNSPILDTGRHPYLQQDKREEHHNPIERSSGYKLYDRFPSPFDHVPRPQPSAVLQPGIDLTRPELTLPLTNGPKSYRLPEPVRSSKFPESNSARADQQRRPFPASQKPPEDPILQPEPKKPSFSIEEITRYALPQNSVPISDASNRTTIPRKSHERHVLGVDPSRLPTSFPAADYYALSAQATVDAPNHFSVSNQLNPLYYMSPMFNNPFMAPTLPISGHSGQVSTSQQQQLLHQQFRKHGPLPAGPSSEAAKLPNDGFARSMTDRRSGVPLNHESVIQDRRSLIYDRDLKPQELREARLDRDDSSIVNSSAAKPTPNIPTSHSVPTRSDQIASSRHSPASRPFVPDPTPSASTNIFSNQDVDMRRKNCEAPVKDTDMRFYLNESASVGENPFRDSGRKASNKQKHSDTYLQKRRNSGSTEPATVNQRQDFSTSNLNVHKPDSRPTANDFHVQNASQENSVKEKIKWKYNKSGHSQVMRQTSKDATKNKGAGKLDANARPKVDESRNEKFKPHLNASKAGTKSDSAKAESHVTSEQSATPLIVKIAKVDDDADKTEAKSKARRGSYKRKNSREQSTETTASDATNPKMNNRLSSCDSDGDSKRGKRRKKSEQTENEYIYWMFHDSSSEPENDDSEDEDFRCPLQKPTQATNRGRKRAMRTRPMRHSRRNACDSFFEPSSPEEPMSEEEKRPTKSSPAAKAGAKRGPKPGSARGNRGTPRKLKRVRKLSSDTDDSEQSTSEMSSDREIMPKKKRMPLPSSDKDEKLPDKPVARRGRLPKKVLAKKKGLMARRREIVGIGGKVKPRPVGRPAKHKKVPPKADKETTSQKNKQTLTAANQSKLTEKVSDAKAEAATADIKVKEAPAQVQDKKTATDSPETSKKARGKRSVGDTKREIKISSPTVDIKLDSSEIKKNIAEMTRRKESGAIALSKKLPDSSCSLVDLFNGKHKPSSLSKKELVNCARETKSPASVNNLFADALTETEALALDAATKSVCSNLDPAVLPNTSKASDPLPKTDAISKIKPADDTDPKPPAQPAAIQPVLDSIPKPSTDTSTVVQAPTEAVKPAKKRGRPKILLSSKISALSQQNAGVQLSHDIQKRLKVHQKETKKSSLHAKYKLKNKLLSKGNELVRPKKGRPPGSGNKKKFQLELLKDQSSPTMKKKPGRKKLVEVATKLSEINASLPRAMPSTSPRDSIQAKIGFEPKTSFSIHPPDKDRPVDSPSPSLMHTPVSSKLLVCASRVSTPLSQLKMERRTPAPSPLPPNMKKLTCNSAIGETLLHKAVRHGYMDNILHYLENGFDVNTKDNAGYTALHEACVKGRVDAARLLLEFGADVNINSEEGTRPIHDAVEYDKVEVTRLLLACGADPMLSKFSGRGVREMIHGTTMRSFLTAYLGELKPIANSDVDDDNPKWNIPASKIFEPDGEDGCDILANPPEEDLLAGEMEFELLNEEPLDTYLVRTSENSGLSNYSFLSDLLRQRKCTRGQFLVQCPVDVKCAQAKIVAGDAELNWISKKVNRITDEEDGLVDLVAHESLSNQTRRFKVSPDGTVVSVPVQTRRSEQTNSWYPRGAYCEKRKYYDVRPQVQENAKATSEAVDVRQADTNAEALSIAVDVPSSSKSSRRNSENTSTSSSDSEMRLSGVTELTTNLDDLKDDVLHPIANCLIPETNLNVPFHNGVEIIPVSCSSSSPPTTVVTPTLQCASAPDQQESDVTDIQSYHYHGLDIAHYSPTSDLRPPVSADNDPSRTLTETENAVLNLAFDAGLPYHVTRTETTKPFLNSFNNVSKSPKPSHVAK